jgi:hypothetical protein
MLTIDLLGRSRAEFRALKRPRVACLTSFRYDAHLVPAMKENLAGVVDAFILWDDRQAAEKFSSEPERRARLIEAAFEIGADWALAVDPDERFEPAFQTRIRRLTRKPDTIWIFGLREMWTPTAWRSDGIWGRKEVGRLWPLRKDDRHRHAPLHSPWAPTDTGMRRKRSGLDLYHLKSIDPRRRQSRAALYSALDPQRKFAPRGYDYLGDETGLELTEIAPERMYRPAHVEDGGLWMPEFRAECGDPLPQIIKRAVGYRADGQTDSALRLLALAAGTHTAPADCGLIARAYLGLGDAHSALACLDGPELAQRPVEDLVLALETCHATGDFAGRDRRLAQALALHPAHPLLELASLRHDPATPAELTTDVFARLGWAKGPARRREASSPPADARMGTVVLCLGAAPEVRGAVASLLDQQPPTYVIVVNSGGGDLDSALGDLAARTTRVEVSAQVFAGAARNIGSALVREPHLAFLASDCLAAPGWVRTRLARQERGPVAVASALVPYPSDNAVTVGHHLALHPMRLPEAASKAPICFGVSIPTLMSHVAGPYRVELRGGEDSIMNEILASWIPVIFVPELITRHCGPTRLLAAFADMGRRGVADARLLPLTINLRLKPWNPDLLRTVLRLPVELFRSRNSVVKERLPREVGWAAPQVYRAARRLVPLMIVACTLGRLGSLPGTLAARSGAWRALRAFGKGGAAADLVAAIGDGRLLGVTVIRQIEAALLDAGHADDAEALLRRVRADNPLLKLRR